MKTLTTREFFHSPGLVKSLRPGQSLVVTDNGAAALNDRDLLAVKKPLGVAIVTPIEFLKLVRGSGEL